VQNYICRGDYTIITVTNIDTRVDKLCCIHGQNISPTPARTYLRACLSGLRSSVPRLQPSACSFQPAHNIVVPVIAILLSIKAQ
jgi:hypothetical protein